MKHTLRPTSQSNAVSAMAETPHGSATQMIGVVRRHRRAGRGSWSFRLGVAWLTLVGLIGLILPLVWDLDPSHVDLSNVLAAPSTEHIMGTDEVGRDVAARLASAATISLGVGVLSALLGSTVGTIVGASAGYYGRIVDRVLMRITDSALAIPNYVFWISALTAFGPSLSHIMLILGFTTWMPLARIVRAEVLQLREREFVEAARSYGSSDARIILRHLVPNVAPSIIVATSLGTAFAILAESALSYLGVGIQPPRASWGNMLSNAQSYITTAPWIAVAPGISIFLTVLAFGAVGDGFRRHLGGITSQD